MDNLNYKALLEYLLEVEIDGRRVRPNGDFKTNSPFREDKRPSFNVNVNDGRWIDFGTNERGNTFSWIKEHLGLDTEDNLALHAQFCAPFESHYPKNKSSQPFKVFKTPEAKIIEPKEIIKVPAAQCWGRYYVWGGFDKVGNVSHSGIIEKGKGVKFRDFNSEMLFGEARSQCVISAFTFPDQFLEHVNLNGNSLRGYNDACKATELYWDMDGQKVPDDKITIMRELVRRQTIELVELLLSIDPDEDRIEICFSGNKGYHIAYSNPTILELPGHTNAHNELKQMCTSIIEKTPIYKELNKRNIKIFDDIVYNKLRLFRLKGSIHSGSGLKKQQISFDELKNKPMDEYFKLPKKDEEFLNII